MTASQEAERILKIVGGDPARAMSILEAQLNVLHTRAQVLLSLAGVVVTVTGFSGKAIASTGFLEKGLVLTGLSLVLASAIWTFSRVAQVQWITSELGDDLPASLTKIVERRNQRTRAYHTGGMILCAGLAFYCAAVALMLAR